MKLRNLTRICLAFLLIMPLIMAADCPDGFICSESSVNVYDENNTNNKVSDPSSNPVIMTILVILSIIIIYIAFKYSRKKKKQDLKKAPGKVINKSKKPAKKK